MKTPVVAGVQAGVQVAVWRSLVSQVVSLVLLVAGLRWNGVAEVELQTAPPLWQRACSMTTGQHHRY